MIEKDYITSMRSLFASCFGEECVKVEPLPQAGSDRRYFRLRSDNGCSTAIATCSSDIEENRCFVRLSRILGNAGMNVPRIYACSDDCSVYLQSDLGSVSLFSMLRTDEGELLTRKCVKALAQLQSLDTAEWESAVMMPPFSKRQVMWDLNYFKYEYLKPSKALFDEDALEDDFERFADRLVSYPRSLQGFMYRDCQSRNVMVSGGEPWWIDYQGGRKGPVVYDIVSFLWQAKAGFTSQQRESLLDLYASELAGIKGIPERDILSVVPAMALFRTLQVLGAYGFRGLVQHKAHFIESIPGALRNLRELADSGVTAEYPQLHKTVCRLVDDTRFKHGENTGKLKVEIFSFSYKKGYPDDYSGNGGGFMFDCRGLHNPGRYDRYKPLTGMDSEVKEFLEERGEVQPFLAAAWQLADQAVACYLRRGFTSLQIGFGCTGGRHRSVYSAEQTGKHIKGIFPDACVIVNHREQHICKEIL